MREKTEQRPQYCDTTQQQLPQTEKGIEMVARIGFISLKLKGVRKGGGETPLLKLK